MKKLFLLIRRYREVSLILLDIFCVLLAYLIGFLFRFIDNPASMGRYYAHFYNILKTIPLVLILNEIFFQVLQINRGLWKYTSLDEVSRICFASLAANFIWFLLVDIIPISPYIRSVPILAALFQIMIMLGVRFIYRLIRTRDVEKHRAHNALIIGAGSGGTLLYRDIMTNDKFDVKVIGFVDDAERLQKKRVAGVEVLGRVEDIPQIITGRKVDIAYIAIPSASKKRLAEIIDICSGAGLKTQIMDYQVKENLEEISTLREISIEDLLGRNPVQLNQDNISGYLTGKTVMVTGGGGSIGSELCRQILKFHPDTLIIFDIYENNMYDLQQELNIQVRKGELPEDIKIVCRIGSVRDKKRLNEIMNEFPVNVVFHAAAHKHVPLVEHSPKEAVKNNVFGTYNTLQMCIAHKVDKFVLISTDKAVNPTNVMGATKRITELIIQAMKDNGVTKVGAVRFGNVLGSNGSVVPLFRRQIQEGGPVTVTDPGIERYFMTIPEAAGLVLQAGAYANHGDIFVLDMGTRVKILSLAEKMITLSGYRPYKDIDIEFIGLRPGEKMYEEISLGNEKRYKTENDLVYVNEPMTFNTDQFKQELEVLNGKLADSSDEEISSEVFRLVEEYK